MHGGVGGVKPQGFPLSRSLAQVGSPRCRRAGLLSGVKQPSSWITSTAAVVKGFGVRRETGKE